MSVRSLQLRPISTSHYYTSGDVTIHAGVAIAPGVLLQADANSRIVIRSGACIGIGAILHAHNGEIEVGEGANVGAEVLLVGQVRIGGNACLGAATTIINSSVEPGQSIPPGSLIGEAGSASQELQATDTVIYPADTSPSATATAPTNVGLPSEANGLVAPTEEKANVNVYGQMYVNRMFVKMFPHHPRSGSTSLDASENNGDDPWDD
ncbi:MAG: hypothetical protein NW224_24890 [Leptolyngbyaceae cyanobacterium bins.302]|nr:hypothetical protein [Leptolyngbyaceae cyanobacterium bins.302]